MISREKYSDGVSRSLTWAASLERDALAAAGYDVIEFAWGAPHERREPGREWLDRVARASRLAVVGVQLRDLDGLAALHGYVRGPALRCGTEVAIESEPRLTRLRADRFVDPGFAYPYTLERRSMPPPGSIAARRHARTPAMPD